MFDPAVLAGHRAPALPAARYTWDEALQRLLAGSGLVSRRTAGGSYVIEAAPASEAQPNPTHDERTAAEPASLERVEIFGKAQGFSVTRLPTALKDVPQSVTVITQQTLQQQNANDLADALNWSTGITVQKSGAEASRFSVRGFDVNTVHVDGGGAQLLGSVTGQISASDLSQYDSVEILRGADALFGGIGQPGGSINLTHKRALPDAFANFTASIGSWNHYRLEADLNDSFGAEGHLRGRVLAVEEGQHYFYDTARSRFHKLYAVGEYDLLPGTLLTLGAVVEKRPDFVAFQAGLPLNQDGSDPQLRRSTALTFPWARNSFTNKEWFARVEHAFSETWKLKAGASRVMQDQTGSQVLASSAINPVTRTIDLPQVMTGNVGSGTQAAVDLTVTGAIDWAGRKQEVVFGFDQSRYTAPADINFMQLIGAPIDLAHFDPSAYAAPTLSLYQVSGPTRARTTGVFAAVKLRPTEALALSVGARRTSYHQDSETIISFGGMQVADSLRSIGSDGVITPFVGATYKLAADYTLYASYAGTTTANARLLDASGNFIGAEKGTNKEIGLKWSPGSGRLTASVALFDIRQINAPQTDPNAPSSIDHCCYYPATERSKGFELELAGRVATGWDLIAGYTFNINRLGEGTALSTVTPKHLLKLWTNYRLPGAGQRWDFGGGVTAQSLNFSEGTACPAFDPASGACTADPVAFRAAQGFYAVATLRAGYRVNDDWALALNLNNLFDRRYYQTVASTVGGNFYGAPRNLTLTLRGSY
ncbi:TonB-dependent siderophore receptor [Pelomonas sp. KK5]|uniref:TonB-dependent siderophore receptor n=1 Tax=Pelomonas sp. KK5 TaxID=1855730 RepID=UPI001301CD47|nr:TonB-dependent siderophore receptor [Pelomonas sp. KK5]